MLPPCRGRRGRVAVGRGKGCPQHSLQPPRRSKSWWGKDHASIALPLLLTYTIYLKSWSRMTFSPCLWQKSTWQTISIRKMTTTRGMNLRNEWLMTLRRSNILTCWGRMWRSGKCWWGHRARPCQRSWWGSRRRDRPLSVGSAKNHRTVLMCTNYQAALTYTSSTAQPAQHSHQKKAPARW